MDRQEFSRLVSEKLSGLNPDSLKYLDEGDESMAVEIVSEEFRGKSMLTRIKQVYFLIQSCVEQADFHVNITPLTLEEKDNNSEKDRARTYTEISRGQTDRVASTSH